MPPQCAYHPERTADRAPCERCGTFVCEGCSVLGSAPAICRPCLERLESGSTNRHVRVLGVLLMIHGGLLAAVGGYYMIFGGVLIDALRGLPEGREAADPSMEMIPGAVAGILASVGLFHIVPGALQALAGWMVLRYRGVALTWVSLFAGLVTLLGCYCFPSAIALAGYGVFVLTRDDVRARLAVRTPTDRGDP